MQITYIQARSKEAVNHRGREQEHHYKGGKCGCHVARRFVRFEYCACEEIIYGGFCWKITSRYSQIADDDTFMTSSIVAVRKTNILADFDPLLAMKVKQFTDDTLFCEKLWSKFGMIFDFWVTKMKNEVNISCVLQYGGFDAYVRVDGFGFCLRSLAHHFVENSNSALLKVAVR